MQSSRKTYFIIGLISFLLLLVLSAIFYRERIAFSDMAYQAVYILIEQKPYVNWIRAGSVIPQFFPLTAIYLHAGLRQVMLIHSMSFIFFYLIIYLIAYRYSHRHLLFFLIPVYLLILTTEVFYWPQSELQQGMIWLCLYAVFLFEDSWSRLSKNILWPLHFLFILWIQFFHPLIFFPILFLVIYYYISVSKLLSRQMYAHIAICCIAFVIRYIISATDIYERGKLNIKKAITDNLPHLLSLDSIHKFLIKIPTSYSVYTIFFFAIIIWLIYARQAMKAALLLILSAGYWLLIMIADPVDNRFYTENMLLPLGFMAGLVLVKDIMPKYRSRLVAVLICAVILFRIGFIYRAHTDYTDRFALYSPYFDHIKKSHLNGVFVDLKLIDQKKFIMTWASGYESILISSLQSPDSCVVVQIDNNVNSYSYALNFDTSLVTIYGIWGQCNIPGRYFKLQKGKYEIITDKDQIK